MGEGFKDEATLRKLYYEDELSMMEIANLYSKSASTIAFYMKKYNLPRRQGNDFATDRLRKHLSKMGKGKPSWNSGLKGNYQQWTKRGKDAPGYLGGVSEKGNRGYRKILIPEHPSSDANGYVYEHRLICEKLLGRYLTDEEIIHHRDSDRLNNDPSNLFIFYGHATHMSFHRAKDYDAGLTEEEFCLGEEYMR